MGDKIINLEQSAVVETSGPVDAGQDSYSGNPNQKTYDQTHHTDHLVDVVDIFFAERKPRMKIEKKEDIYTVRTGGKITDVVGKYQQAGRGNFTTEPNHQNPLNPEDKIKVMWEESVQEKDKNQNPLFDYIKLQKGELGCETWLVAKVNGDNGTLKVEIYEDKRANEALIFTNPVNFLEGDTEKASYEFKINGAAEYPVKIKVRPKKDEDFKALGARVEARKDKQVLLFIKAGVSGTSDEVKFPANTPEFYTGVSGRFIANYCYCCLYKIENNLLQGPDVVHSKSGSNVKPVGDLQPVKAIIMHRTSGWSTEGAIAAAKGTHFYVDGARGSDGEIYQPFGLDKAASHILSKNSRTAHLEIQSENSIGIEVVGWPYNYNEKKELVNALNGNISDGASVYLEKGYTYPTDPKAYYWEQLTEKQIKSIVCLVKVLMKRYDLTVADIYAHDEIQIKNPGEGRYVMDIILPLLNK